MYIHRSPHETSLSTDDYTEYFYPRMLSSFIIFLVFLSLHTCTYTVLKRVSTMYICIVVYRYRLSREFR
ncbi:hypothetical protein CSUI_007754, partial [Cystoisospora suis]